MENDIERNGITLGDLLKAVLKKIWIVVIATLVAAIAAGLLVKLWYNPSRVYYSLEFTLVYPGREQLKYPDGAPFYYKDIISAEMLERAKASNEQLKSVDVGVLLSQDKISVTERAEGRYTLKAAQSGFESSEVATVFLKAVATMPLQIVKERAAETDYHLSESVYGSAYSFQDRISLLTSQRANLLEQYDNWIALFDSSFIVAGEPLKDYRADVEVVFSDSLKEDLLKELNAYGYVLPARLESRIAELRQERAVNDVKIRELKAVLAASGDHVTVAGKESESLSYMLATLTVRNVEIDYQLEALTEENITAFEQIINREYARLEQAADTIQAVSAAIFEQEARINFVTAGVGTEGGKNSIVIAAFAGFAFFFLSSAVICVVAFSRAPKSEKNEKDEQLGQNETAE